MDTNTINAKTLRNMFLAGAKNIEAKKEWINELNVFPVPDGDTGTNMTLTIMSAAKEVNALEDTTMEVLAKAISSGSLRGARGNSGVILSQLLRGFTKEIRKVEEIDIPTMASAFERATETAYKAVMKPKEGTILTVARGAAEKAVELVGIVDDMGEFLDAVIKEAEEVLNRTPEMLPVLKQAGVVDSGGQGLVQVLKGAYDAFMGKEVNFEIAESSGNSIPKIENGSAEEIRFGYCTEFIIMLEKKYTEDTEVQFKAYLESIGDSIVVVSDDGIVKVHVHTNNPGLAIEKALTYGSLTSMKIDNMREEHQEKLIKDAEKVSAQQKQAEQNKKALSEEPKKEVGFISVSIGEGLNEIFRGIGVDYLIEGGQTMNPSTADMLTAIDAVNAKTIFIMPNNKNIILAAEQAKALVKDKRIIVIPSKTIPQGITAIINYMPDKSCEENERRMIEEMERVKTGQVTYAVRDTSIDGKEIKKGDMMGIGDHAILTVGTKVMETALNLACELADDESELISIYYGADVSEEEAEKLAAEIEERYPDCDVEVNQGGQPIYYYILSVE